MQIRRATTADAAALREIYRPYVEATAVSFELEVPSIEEFERRISVAVAGWSWFVALTAGCPVGYAYGSAHRAREAYRFSVETSAYVHHNYVRQGIGRTLYTQLLNELRERGFASAFAAITVPNEASVRFHESLGFEQIGVFPRVGHKFGRWHDVAWFYRPVSSEPLPTGVGHRGSKENLPLVPWNSIEEETAAGQGTPEPEPYPLSGPGP